MAGNREGQRGVGVWEGVSVHQMAAPFAAEMRRLTREVLQVHFHPESGRASQTRNDDVLVFRLPDEGAEEGEQEMTDACRTVLQELAEADLSWGVL